MRRKPYTAAVIVAHPDDETLWSGGTILSHPSWTWHIICLCRASDPDRAPKFHTALTILGAQGAMADLDDGPDQTPLDPALIRKTITALVPRTPLNLLITHNPSGEYTRHLRHEETAHAVITLWTQGAIDASELWTFAYEDNHRAYNPKPIETASLFHALPQRTWRKKYRLITDTYGFEAGSFEAQTTPRAEAFFRFTDKQSALTWLQNGGLPA